MYLLAIVGTLMIIEGVKEVDQARKKIIIKKKLHQHNWFQARRCALARMISDWSASLSGLHLFGRSSIFAIEDNQIRRFSNRF